MLLPDRLEVYLQTQTSGLSEIITAMRYIFRLDQSSLSYEFAILRKSFQTYF